MLLAANIGVQLQGNANAAQIKGAVIAFVKTVVLNYERDKAAAAAEAAVTPISPT